MSCCASMAEGQKTVGALELALRAARSGQATCLIQLLPGREPCGELAVPDELLTKLNIFPALRGEKSGVQGAASSADGLSLARLALVCGRYDLLILDEVPETISAGYVSEEEIRGLTGTAKTRLIVIGMPAGNSRTTGYGSPRKQQRRNHLTA